MFYILQNNIFREYNYNKIYDSLNRLNLEFEEVEIKPFIDDYTFETKRNDIFVFGGIKLAMISSKYGWKPGSLMNDNHNFEVYSKHYKEKLLNYDSVIFNLGDDIEFDGLRFIRPCADSKLFTGNVFSLETWNSLKDSILKNGKNPSLKIQLAQPKKIHKEFRLFIVGDEIVTGSQYSMNGIYYTSEVIDDEVIDFAKEMINIYKIADCFVMDIALTDNGCKIVECGCINACGFYKSDLIKLLISIENFYG
jgi:hypothetical protein